MKKFNAIDHIADLNVIKSCLGDSFTKEQLNSGLKECDLPSNGTFWME